MCSYEWRKKKGDMMVKKIKLTKKEKEFRVNGIKYLIKELNERGGDGQLIFNAHPAISEAIFLAGFSYAFELLEKDGFK